MFNTLGVETISTRHVADEMGISVGNLHYHYANKNEVIKSLLSQFIEKTDSLALELKETDLKYFSDYQLTVIKTFEVIQQYRFLFNDRLILTRKIPEMENMFREMLIKREGEFYAIIEVLRKEGLLRKDLAREQFSNLFKQIVMLYNSWGSHTSLFNLSSVNENQIPTYFAQVVSSIWLPYFSEEGLKKAKAKKPE